MKTLLKFMTASTIGFAALATPVGAQPVPKANAEPPRAVHGGGVHDEQLHMAALRARQQGQRMNEPQVHPGGRHNERAHQAALRAQAAAD